MPSITSESPGLSSTVHQNMTFHRGCHTSRMPSKRRAPVNVTAAEKEKTPTYASVRSLMAPLMGPPAKAPNEQKAIMVPMRNPM